jgi:sodium-dependent phosphate cotransporter
MTFLFVFLVGISTLSSGIKGLGKGTIDGFITAANNPFLGLVTGILATTLAQSSSVTTSLIVAMVASGKLPFSIAIPMIMGANIGTTVTNTIAALAQNGRKTEFRRAFAAATCHDFFNYLVVIVLLPLEMATGFLARLSAIVNSLLPTIQSSAEYKSPFKVLLKTCVGWVESAISMITEDKTTASVLLIIAGALLIFGALTMIVRVMKTLVLSKAENYINRILNRGAVGGFLSMMVGVILTVAVQSSSITTSLMVPLAGAGLVRIWQVFPVTVGANIGTTVTALIASLAVSGDNADVARQIAIVHLLFNLTGTLLFYVPPYTRKWPMHAAQRLARVASRSRRWALVYVLAAFYGLPALLVFIGGKL